MNEEILETVLQQAQSVPVETVPAFLGKLETIKITALARLLAPATAVRPEDQLIDVDAAAARLSVSPGYLYRHHEEFQFTRRIGKRLLFSSSGIETYISKQGGNKR
jgi:hypothetical protein